MPILTALGVLLALGILLPALHVETLTLAGAEEFLRLGNLAYGLFIACCLLLIVIGWRIDQQPGRAIILGVAMLMAGSLLDLFFGAAVAGGWLGVWHGLLAGFIVIMGYIGWRIRARFALVALGLIAYVSLVTAGLFLSVEPRLTVPLIIAVIAVAGDAFGLLYVLYDRISAGIRADRRGDLVESITCGAVQALRPVLIWSTVPLLIALPAALFGTGPFRSLGLFLSIGAVIAGIAVLCAPAALQSAAPHAEPAPVPERSGRRRRA